jgi:hypothetical protein
VGNALKSGGSTSTRISVAHVAQWRCHRCHPCERIRSALMDIEARRRHQRRQALC